MTAFEIFGFICLLLLCFGMPAYLIAAYIKNEKRNEYEKIAAKKSKVYLPEYLLAILPILLLLIGLFSTKAEEKMLSIVIVSVLYPLIILFYAVRIGIPKINFIISTTCLLIALTGLYFCYKDIIVFTASGSRVNSLLYLPILTYFYLLISRKIIFKTTGCYPLFVTLKDITYIHFDGKQNRQATYWDVIWSVASVLLIIALGFIINILYR